MVVLFAAYEAAQGLVRGRAEGRLTTQLLEYYSLFLQVNNSWVPKVVPFSHLQIDDLRNKCKHQLEVFELWLRRLVNDELTDAYGSDYFEYRKDGQYIFRGEIRQRAADRMTANPGRYIRPIDALLLDDLVTTLCKEQLYTDHFRAALETAFPEGNSEARTFLARIVSVRNPLYHANPISYHQAARVFCYTEDVIQSIKAYYSAMGKDSEYNAPSFVAFRDSAGNNLSISRTSEIHTLQPIFRPGDTIRMEVDIDDSFSADDCTIKWAVVNIGQAETGEGKEFILDLKPAHVSEQLSLLITLHSNKEWHRHGNYDARLAITYKVLPPL